MDDRLVILLKAPRAGQVKTRLAQTVGASAACAIYLRLVDHLVTALAALERVDLVYAPDDAASQIERWRQPAWGTFPQGSGDLGTRLISAFDREFASGARRVVIIGSDCPQVTPTDITDAWRALQDLDVVLGPATDGGYWLIGLRAPRPSLFTDMIWSQSSVLPETLRRIGEAGLTVTLLRELSDVDTYQDWQQFSGE